MRTTILALAVAGGLAVTMLPPSQARACSIRGNFCGYPSWAANTFEGRKGFQGNPAILTEQYGNGGRLVRKPKRGRK